MIFSTLLQVDAFFGMIFGGIVFYLFYFLINILFFPKIKNNISKNIHHIFFSLFFTLFFIIFLNLLNFGEFNIFLLIVYVAGFCWVYFTFKNLLAFLQNKWYTFFCKVCRHFDVIWMKKYGSIKDN